jgi:hypothetical protein
MTTRQGHSHRRLGLLGAAALLTLAPTLAPPLGAQAETPSATRPELVPPPPPDIALNVATELATLGGAGARLDTSSGGIKCIFGADPAPLTYSTREIVIRANLTKDEAAAAVEAAIGSGPGEVDTVESIPLPTVPGPAERAAAEPLEPLLVVHLLPLEGEPRVVQVARRLRDDGIKGSPNYLMAPQRDGPVGVLPNGYPVNTDIVTPPREDTLGDGTNAFVMDVGIPPAKWANRPDNVEQLELGADKEILDTLAPKGKVDRYHAGHTVVISHEIDTLAPAARVQAVKVTGARRVITDVSATKEMSDALRTADDAPEVIIASFGSPACNVSSDPADGELVPLGLQAIIEVVHRRGESVIVAAAGNNSTNRRFYPGAFDTDPAPDPDNDVVIGVGALDVISATDPVDAEDTGMWLSDTRSGPPADFSNFGPWVDAWAPGHGLPVGHIKDLYFNEGEDVMTGQALVDGTSYAAPYVGALVLEQYAEQGGTPLSAWRAIRNAGAVCERELGGRAVALPAMDSPADVPATGVSECVR